MKKAFVLAAVVLALGSSEVFAQNTGTVTILGRVEKAAAIRWWSYTPLNSETGVNTPATQNGVLSFQLDLSDMAAGNNLDNYSGGAVQVILRSNTAYTLTAQVTASSGFGTAANGDLALADVGVGVTGLTNSGPKVFGDPAAGSTIAAGFNADPSAAAKDVDEEPIFGATLNDLTGGTQILNGPRISNRGGIGSPNNGLIVDTMYAIGPQFYTPVDPFSATVTYTLATP
jgi:hypothetical protein